MKPVNNTAYRALNCYTKLMRAAESVTSRTSRQMAGRESRHSPPGLSSYRRKRNMIRQLGF